LPSGGRASTRPGGRTAVHTRRILDATIDLLVEGGMTAVSFQAVAERAAVGRATMYRRWSSPAHLAVDAIRARSSDDITVADHGSLTADLTTVLRQIGQFISSPVGRAALIASLQIGPATRSADRLPNWSKRWEQVVPIFDRAIARGELDSGTDSEATFATLAGALYFRVHVMGQHVDDAWIDRVITTITSNAPAPGASNDRRRAGAE
jgi:AcrR family transcriptional regulator